MVKILYILQGLGTGGVSSVILNYYRSLKADVRADFVVIVAPEVIPESLRAELRADGCEIFHVTPFTKNMAAYRSEVKRIIQRGQYDIVHDNNKYFAFLSLGSAKRAGVERRICHVHNTVAAKEKNLIHRTFIHMASALSVKDATALVACSQQAGESMFGENAFTVLNNAVDVDRYAYQSARREYWRAQLGLQGQFVLIMVARRDVLKRFDHAFRVFGAVNRRIPESVFLIAGMEEKDCLERDRASLMSLPETARARIRMLGRRTDANELLNAADGFLLTSEHEGLGISIVEAQANGLPCFVSTGVPQEARVTDLVEYLPCLGDEEQWAEAIVRRGENADREKYADILRSTAYSIENAVGKLREVYGLS